MALRQGTTLEATVVRVVDGDTLLVSANDVEERLRLAALDTEESNHGSDKPVTPWGKEAKREATEFFEVGAPAILEFAGNEPLEVCLTRYRDNFGRLLVWAYRGEDDFQQHMIRNGYSPYFTKYGYANFPSHHDRYLTAQRAAQSAHIGVWNQAEVNGSEMRNYALLGVWWDLRGQVIDDYRRFRERRPALLNSRLDYETIVELAREGEEAVIFTELRSYTKVGSTKAIVEIGSKHQPFKVFLPDVDEEDGQQVLALLDNRYIAKDPDHPRRSYAYVKGPLKLHRDEPEVTVTSVEQISDAPPS